MMGLVVDHQDVPGIGHLAQHFPNIGFIALGPTLVYALLLGNLLFAFPVQHVPVVNQDPALAKLLNQAGGHDVELVEVVPRTIGNQDLKPVSHGQARGHDEDVPGKPGILPIGDLVEDLPRRKHGHHDGLARARSHLGAQPPEKSAVTWDYDSPFLGRAGLNEPNERLDGFQLAEEEPAVIPLLGVLPVFQQPSGDPRHPWVVGFPPSLHPRPNPVDQRQFPKDPGSSKDFAPGVAVTYPAGRLPCSLVKNRVCR